MQPRVSIQVSEPTKLNLLVRVPTPVGRQGGIEQAIVRRFLEKFHPENSKAPTGNAAAVVSSLSGFPGSRAVE